MKKNNQGAGVQPLIIQNAICGMLRQEAITLALHFNLFSIIAEKNYSIGKICKQAGTSIRGTRFLLEALVGMGLLVKSKMDYKLGAEAQVYLVKKSSQYIGDYVQGLIERTPRFKLLQEAVLKGKVYSGTTQDKEAFFQDLVQQLYSVSYQAANSLVKKLGVGKSLKAPRVLDLACGSAAWSIPFAIHDSGCQVVANDFASVLKVAQAYVQRFHLQKQYTWLEGDLLQLDLAKASFDVIILGHILHGIGEAESRKLIKKCYDALKPGGRIVIAEFLLNDIRTGPELCSLFGLNMLFHTENGDVYTGKDLKRWLSFAGFKKTLLLNLLYPTQAMVATK